MPTESHMVRYNDRVVISDKMCRDSGPGGGHICFKDRHPLTEEHECLCTETWKWKEVASA